MKQKILIITDAWEPQVNGVVRTLKTTVQHLIEKDYDVFVIHPQMFCSVPLPGYNEIRLSLFPRRRVGKLIKEFCPDYIHISTEGPLGWAARNYCVKHKLGFSTAYHTMFPEYVNIRWGLPASWGYSVVRKFHKPAGRVMVATQALKEQLQLHSFKNSFGEWTRGVDHEMFHPKRRTASARPYALYVGRVSHEKNLEAFLSLDLPDLDKIVIGKGPHLEALRARFPKTFFIGERKGEELATYYASAEVFVFPSKTDTFGLVMIESLASGTPVAAYDVANTRAILYKTTGACEEDLGVAITNARKLSRNMCRLAGTTWTWQRATGQFLANLVPAYP